MVGGYFDPIHPGHIKYFQEAKKLGTWLIVAIDGNERTINKKGAYFMPAEDRAEIIKALECVDEVYIENVDIKEALRHHMPDIFCKSGDRNSRETIPEWGLCDELGIEVKIVEITEGIKKYSSSDYLKHWEEHFLNKEDRIKLLNDD